MIEQQVRITCRHDDCDNSCQFWVRISLNKNAGFYDIFQIQEKKFKEKMPDNWSYLGKNMTYCPKHA